MFLHVSVILLTGGGCLLQFFGGVSAPNFWGGACSKFSGGVSAPYFRWGAPIFEIRSPFGRYASYWNAFLLQVFLPVHQGELPLPHRRQTALSGGRPLLVSWYWRLAMATDAGGTRILLECIRFKDAGLFDLPAYIPKVKIIKIHRCFWLTLKPHSHYACAFASVCAFAFASNCNIASMGCCVKRKEWTILCGIEPILCVWVKLQTKTHSVNGPLQCTDQGYTTQVSGETTILARRLQLLEAKHCNDGIFSQ